MSTRVRTGALIEAPGRDKTHIGLLMRRFDDGPWITRPLCDPAPWRRGEPDHWETVAQIRGGPDERPEQRKPVCQMCVRQADRLAEAADLLEGITDDDEA